VVERKTHSRISNAEIKAGIFLTFCIALFVAMLFVVGKFGRSLRGRQEITVAFAQVNALRAEAPVLYDGMDLGHVKALNIVRVDQDLLLRMPPLTRRDIANLPLDEEDRQRLSALPEPDVDSAARKLMLNRTMVLLTLNLLSEHDSQRFRIDDEYRIAGSMMGDSSVEIRTGIGKAIVPSQRNVFVGVGGDMYTDLGKSLSQVKDILGSMAEMVGGDAAKHGIQMQLVNFDGFTSHLEDVAGSMLDRMPKTWDGANTRIDKSKTALLEFEAKIRELKPKIDDSLERAAKTIAGMRQSAVKSLDDAQLSITSYRKDALDSTRELRKTAADYKESIPRQIHDARAWSDRMGPTVAKIDNFCSRADDQLDKGIDSLKTAFRGYLATAVELEHTAYNVKTWPWLLSKAPDTEEKQLYFDTAWRHDLLRRHYRELRAELLRTRESLRSSGATDQSRIAHIDQILRESDAELALPNEAGVPAPAPAPSGRKK
jgi:ABC-type transporter Mla subunit MlaD